MTAPQATAGMDAIATALDQLEASARHLRTVSPGEGALVIRAARRGFATAANAAAILARQANSAVLLAGYTRAVHCAASRYLAPRTSTSTLYVVPFESPANGRRRAEPGTGAGRADTVRRTVRSLAVELDVVLSRSAQLVPEAVHADACRQAARLAYELAHRWHSALSTEVTAALPAGRRRREAVHDP
ncbi:hypothetical protein [Amycolatopsis sp. MEPSY49]|uniref:hypothetical protein n=1 Tax=Amycolatopsis sp. MEPSY49 TaxID=3151600 RepID=UPI003EF4C229